MKLIAYCFSPVVILKLVIYIIVNMKRAVTETLGFHTERVKRSLNVVTSAPGTSESEIERNQSTTETIDAAAFSLHAGDGATCYFAFKLSDVHPFRENQLLTK